MFLPHCHGRQEPISDEATWHRRYCEKSSHVEVFLTELYALQYTSLLQLVEYKADHFIHPSLVSTVSSWICKNE